MDDECAAIETALAVLGRAWAAATLKAMLSGAERFSEIRRGLPGITDAVLSTRLKELCEAGMAQRLVEPGPPVVVRYRLTAAGRDVEPVLAALVSFGRRHGGHPAPTS